MSNTEQIEEALKSLILEDNRAFVAMLSGEWGIGKTYFWKKFKERYLKEKKVVDISLFGCSSLQEIEERILTGLYSYNSFIEKYAGRLNLVSGWLSKIINIPIQISAGSILSMFKSEDFENIIICFDDFERLSDKVPLKDVMGLIAQFKEDKKCKIIMILNEGELSNLSDIDGKGHDEIFALYKEKIVDYSFHYQPSQEELFEAVSKDIAEIDFCDHQTIYDFFTKIDLKNIRIMKQALWQLKHFSFIKDKGYDKRVVDEFIEIALNLFVFKARSNYVFEDYKALEKYYYTKMWNSSTEIKDEDFTLNEKHEKNIKICESLWTNHTTRNEEEIINIIYRFIDTLFINEDRLLQLLSDDHDRIARHAHHDEIMAIHYQFISDFSVTDQEISSMLLSKLEKYKEDIPLIFSFEEFKKIMQDIKDCIDFPKEFEEEIIKHYIHDGILRVINDEHSVYEENLSIIEKEYEWAPEYIQEQKITALNLSVADIPTIIQSVVKSKYCSSGHAIALNAFTAEEYKEQIIHTPTLIKPLVAFCSSSVGGSSTENAKKRIAQALTMIWCEDEEQKRKVERIAKYANLILGDCGQ